MKKIFSLLIAVATVLSTASAVFAANYTYTLTPSVEEAKPGDVIEFKLTLPGTPGVAYFKNVLNFDGATFAHDQYFSEDDYDYVDAYSKLGAVTYNETETGRALFVMSRATDNKNPWLMTVCYKVADDAVNGEYTFTIDDEQVLQAAGNQLDIAAGTATIKVTGGKDPAPVGPTELKATAEMVAPVVSPSNPNTTTQGIKGKVDVPAGKTFSKLVFTLNNGSVDKEWTWNLGTAFETSVESYGVNILGVPSGIEITCSNVEAE